MSVDSQGVNSVRNDKFERRPGYFLRKCVFLFVDVYRLQCATGERLGTVQAEGRNRATVLESHHFFFILKGCVRDITGSSSKGNPV